MREQTLIETEAAKRASARPPSSNAQGKDGKSEPYLPFLTHLPGILDDLERRVGEAHPPFSLKNLMAEKDQTQRILALVQALDQVSWDPTEDSIVKALVREGEPAITPLLDCLEHDKRLTRLMQLAVRLYTSLMYSQSQ